MKNNENLIIKDEHDESLGVKKVAMYGWDGSKAVMVKCDASGNIVVSGGVEAFTDLSDTPSSYSGAGGKAVYVNSGATGLEFKTAVSSDEKVKYDAGDPTAGYVVDKFVAGTGITLAEGTGADENKLKISNSVAAGANTALSNLVSPSINADLIFQEGAPRSIGVEDQTTVDTGGNTLSIGAGKGNGTGTGGDMNLSAAQGGATGNGGALGLSAGTGGDTSGDGGDATLEGGSGNNEGNGGNVFIIGKDGVGTNKDGGDVYFKAGNKTGSGVAGKFVFAPLGATANEAILDFDSIASTDKTFVFPNASGTVALTTTAPAAHNTSHQSGGSDAIKLDDLAAPDDNTDLDFSTSKHGLVPKGTNAGNFLKDDGTWAAAGGGGGLTWNEVTGTSQSAAVDNGYICNNAALVTVTLPSTAAVGKVVRIAGLGAGGWKVAQNASQYIKFGNVSTTVGATGYLQNTVQYDAIELLCIVTNNGWEVLSSAGNIIVN